MDQPSKKFWRIAIVGWRKYEDFDFVYNKFKSVIRGLKISPDNVVIVSGGAKGVDTIAEKIAVKIRGKFLGDANLIVYKAEWHKYGRRAGPYRNTKIVNVSDIVIAFPHSDSIGTWDTINKAKKHQNKKKVIVYNLASDSD